MAGRSPDVATQLSIIHCRTCSLFTLWPCPRAQACSTVGTSPRGASPDHAEPHPASERTPAAGTHPRGPGEPAGCRAEQSWAVSEAGLVREEAGDHMVPGPAPPSGPHLGGSGTAAPDQAGVSSCLDPCRQAELGSGRRGRGSSVSCGGAPRKLRVQASPRRCVSRGGPREIAAKEGGRPGPSTTLSARGRPTCWTAACSPASRPRL